MPQLRLPALPADGRYLIEGHTQSGPWHTAVVVPARDEAERIVACLESLRCQWSAECRTLLGQFAVVVVVNGTSDATCARVQQWQAIYPEMPLVLVDVDFPAADAHVGSARRLGLSIAGELLRQHGRGPRMLFSTDADTRLAPDALAEAYAYLQRGADAVGALIRAGEPDTSQIGLYINRYRALHARIRHRYYRGPLDRTPSHGDFGGAGFAVTLAAYESVGGLPSLSYDEDQQMRRRLLDAGRTVVYPRSVVVYTSTRHDGRAEWGMAKQLAVWEREYAAQQWPTMPCANGLVWKYALKAALREGRAPVGYFDPSGQLASVWTATDPSAPFEARWRAFWHDATVAELRESRFPQLSLPQAYQTLERAHSSAHFLAAAA